MLNAKTQCNLPQLFFLGRTKWFRVDINDHISSQIFAQINLSLGRSFSFSKIRQVQTWPGCVTCHQTNNCPLKFKRHLRTKHTPNLSYCCDCAIYGNNNVWFQDNSVCFCAIHHFGLPKWNLGPQAKPNGEPLIYSAPLLFPRRLTYFCLPVCQTGHIRNGIQGPQQTHRKPGGPERDSSGARRGRPVHGHTGR